MVPLRLVTAETELQGWLARKLCLNKKKIEKKIETFSLIQKMENMKFNKDGSFSQKGVPIHSQVRKIKQESEKIVDWSPGQPEIRFRPVLREISRQISRSPLGISGQPISVGES